jgi:hypothetical protein
VSRVHGAFSARLELASGSPPQPVTTRRSRPETAPDFQTGGAPQPVQIFRLSILGLDFVGGLEVMA